MTLLPKRSPFGLAALLLPVALFACASSRAESEANDEDTGEQDGGAGPEEEGAGGADSADAAANAAGAGGAGGRADEKPDARVPPGTTKDATVSDAVSPPVYDPCPSKGVPCRIMPVGDSNTEAFQYRVALFRKANAAGRQLTYVGSAASGPSIVDGRMFPRQHEGYGGVMIDGIASRVATSLANNEPHIVLLMIGTNDAHRSPDLPTAPARLGVLVDTIAKQSPKALIVVAKIVPSKSDPQAAYYAAGHDERIRTFNTALGPELAARQLSGKHVLVVDMYEAFTDNPNYKTAYMADNLHPSSAGFDVMATVWWKAIEPVVK